MESFPFGDSPELANELLALVLNGKKTATTWAAIEGLKGTVVGKRWIAKDGTGKDRVVLETTELTKLLFKEVDGSIAYDEGEGDQTLEYYRTAHINYFNRNGQYGPDMEVYCERFKIVTILP